MTTTPLTIHVSPDAAQAFLGAPEEDRRKLESLLDLQVKRFVAKKGSPLLEIADRIGREAMANGMTPEILESILNDE